MKDKEQKAMYTVVLPLEPTCAQQMFIEKKFFYGFVIQNAVTAKVRDLMEANTEKLRFYAANQYAIKSSIEEKYQLQAEGLDAKQKKDLMSDKKKELQPIDDKIKATYKEIDRIRKQNILNARVEAGLSEIFDMRALVDYWIRETIKQKGYSKFFNYTDTEAIRDNVLAAHKTVYYPTTLQRNARKGKKAQMRFTKLVDFNRMQGRRKLEKGTYRANGMHVVNEKGVYYLVWPCNSKAQNRIEPLKIPLGHQRKYGDYELSALRELATITRIVRKRVKGQWRYTVQLSVDGKSPAKNHLKKPARSGSVGIDPGPSKMAVYAQQCNVLDIIQLPNHILKAEAQIAELNRKMDKSQRINNPHCYRADGTFIKNKRITNYSQNYKKMRARSVELSRKATARKEQWMWDVVNEIVSLGDYIKIEKSSFAGWAKRAEGIRISKKTGKYQSNKRFGKSIGRYSPASFVSKLKYKAAIMGLDFLEVETYSTKCTQYRPWVDKEVKVSLNVRKIKKEDGVYFDRDALAAYNISHVDVFYNANKKAKKGEAQVTHLIAKDEAIKNFEHFEKIHNDSGCIRKPDGQRVSILSSFIKDVK